MRKELGSARAVHTVGSPKQVVTMAMQIKSLEVSLAAAKAAVAVPLFSEEPQDRLFATKAALIGAYLKWVA